MGKKAASTRRSGAGGSAEAKDDASRVPNYGFEQFRNEGPLFWIRQLGGLVLVVLGSVILASAYTEDYWYLPLPPEYGPYCAIALIFLGAVVHEFRPWKVRYINAICQDLFIAAEVAAPSRVLPLIAPVRTMRRPQKLWLLMPLWRVQRLEYIRGLMDQDDKDAARKKAA